MTTTIDRVAITSLPKSWKIPISENQNPYVRVIIQGIEPSLTVKDILIDQEKKQGKISPKFSNFNDATSWLDSH